MVTDNSHCVQAWCFRAGNPSLHTRIRPAWEQVLWGHLTATSHSPDRVMFRLPFPGPQKLERSEAIAGWRGIQPLLCGGQSLEPDQGVGVGYWLRRGVCGGWRMRSETEDTNLKIHNIRWLIFGEHREVKWRRKWQPTPVFLPGESQGQGSLVGCRLWGRTELDTTEAT